MHIAPAHMDIMAKCMACGQEREFDKRQLPAHLQHADVEDVEARLKCSACGAKAGKLEFGHYEGSADV
jgi:NifU-like protein involved in Fe-S cluster formation